MQLVFAGTPPFAATALDALARDGHEVQAVLHETRSRADRGEAEPVGRDRRLHRREVTHPAGKHLDTVEAEVGGGPASCGEAVVQHERAAGRLRDETDRDRRLHARDPDDTNRGLR